MLNSKLQKPTAVSAKGAYIHDESGRHYLDACSGALVVNIGHGVQEIIDAERSQAEKVSFVYRTQFTSPVINKLTQTLLDKSPGYANVLYVNSGSEAIEAAMRLSRLYWRLLGKSTKEHALSRWVSYHGMTRGALEISGHSQRRAPYANQLGGRFVAPAFCQHCPFGKKPENCGVACADDLLTTINRIGNVNVGCFVVEPVTGASGGAIPPHPDYFKKVRKICDEQEVLLIADEVLTGLGRTGQWLALDHWQVQADISVIGKGLGAGYTPIGAVLISKKVWDVFMAHPGAIDLVFGHTYSANPKSAAVSSAVLDYMDRHDVIGNVQRLAPALEQVLRSAATGRSIITDIRGKGFLWALELEGITAQQVVQHALSLGLVVYPVTGFLGLNAGEAVIVAPPLTVGITEINEIGRLLQQTFRELEIHS